MTPKVLHVVTALGLGGAEVWLIALLRENAERRASGEEHEEIHILMTGGRPAELDTMASELGATLHYIPFARKSFFKFALEFRRLLKRERFSAVHDQQDYSSAWHFLAGAGLLPETRIIHVHNPLAALRNNTDTQSRRFLFEIAKRIVRSSATHVLGTSSHALREYGFTARAFPSQRIATVHCGFDVNQFGIPHEPANSSVCREFGWPEGSRIVVFAGRLEGFDRHNSAWNHKNPQFALDVVLAALDQGADFRFIMAGEGDRLREELIAQAARAGYSDRIVLPGRRLDIARIMAASHVCLFPSREEGLGMVAVEAQAAGLRVLASDAVPDEAVVVSDLVTFLPLSAGVARWATELTKLLSLPRTDAAAAGDFVRRSDFSIERSYENLHAIYSS